MVGGVHRESRRCRSANTRDTLLKIQIRQRPTKVASRKHCIKTHFPKDRNCEVCKRTKMTRAPCRRRSGKAVLRAEKLGDLITANHKVFNEGGESRKQSLIRSRGTRFSHSMDSILSVQNKNFSGDGQEFTKVSRSIGKADSHLYRQFIGIWQNLVKTYRGIIIDPRRMVLLRERYAEERRRLQCCCKQAWMKNGGLVLWHALAICEMSKTSCRTGEHLMNGDSENY